MEKSKLLFIVLVICCLSTCRNNERFEGIEIKKSGKAVAVFYNGTKVLTRPSIEIKLPDSTSRIFQIDIKENIITADLGKYGYYKETITRGDSNYMTGIIELSVRTDAPFIAHCPFDLNKPDLPPYFMIPCFLYGTNNIETSTGRQPKLNYGGEPGIPESSVFYTRADRSSHPGVLVISDKRVMLAGVREKLEGGNIQDSSLWDPDHLYTGLFLNTSFKKKDVIGYSLGYEHYPFRYNGKTTNPVVPEQDEYCQGWIREQNGKTLTTNTFYYVGNANDKTDYGKALEAYYYDLHELPKKRTTRQDAMKKLINAQILDAWNEEHEYFRVVSKKDAEGDVGWTGGMQDAYPLLMASKKIRHEKAEKIAIRYINNLVNNGFNEKANLLYEAKKGDKWHVVGWWQGHMWRYFGMESPEEFQYHSAYINGQASYYLLKCYELTGKKHQKWFDIASTVIETAMKGQNKEGAYPSFFSSEDGKPVDYSWFHSCWFVPGVAMLYQLTGEEKYLESARKAILYYNRYHKKGEVHGTPMDTHNAVDQEGNLAYIAGCTELHKTTRDSMYIPLARDGLNWEFTWKFAYNSAHSNEPLKSLDWSTCGGSVTSTHNVHIHHMSNLIAGDIYYWYTLLDDPYIGDRLKDMCIWGLGSFNRVEGEFGFGKAGWATEQFFHTDGLQDNNTPWDGGVWHKYLSWSAACVLLNCAEDIPDEFFGE